MYQYNNNDRLSEKDLDNVIGGANMTYEEALEFAKELGMRPDELTFEELKDIKAGFYSDEEPRMKNR